MQRTFKGIPDCWRATVWHEWLEDQARELGNRETKAELIQSYYVCLLKSLEDPDGRHCWTKIVRMTHKLILMFLVQ